MYFSKKALLNQSITIKDPYWNIALKAMYQYIKENVDKKDKKIQENIKKQVAIASDICYNKYSFNEDNLFVPLPFKDNETVLLIRVDYPNKHREEIALIDIAEDMVLLKYIGRGSIES